MTIATASSSSPAPSSPSTTSTMNGTTETNNHKNREQESVVGVVSSSPLAKKSLSNVAYPTTPTLTPASNSSSSSTISCCALLPVMPVVKNYAWGIRGMDSRVARYAYASQTLDTIDPDVPYAELWIGTHPSGPAMLLNSNTNDNTTNDTNNNGNNGNNNMSLRQHLGKDLPFLFKILSAGKALSIQAHPDLTTAQVLHANDPVHYKDANHKPEMAIALTPFEAMCGFRRLEEVAVLLKKHEEFAACISQEAQLGIFKARTKAEQRCALEQMLRSFLTCPPEIATVQLDKLLQRLQLEETQRHPHPHDSPPWERKCARAILRLAKQFPNDVTTMAPFFLNYLLIAPGESFFMAANEPHAYVAGEILECMACSDNVVRAGLTPKFKDVDTLCRMLTYSQGGPSIDAGAPIVLDQDTGGTSRILRYTPPVPEFEVLILTCPPNDRITLTVPSLPAIVVILEGTGYIENGTTATATTTTNSSNNVDGNDDKNKNKTTTNATTTNTVCQPGQCYYHPADAPSMVFGVPSNKQGPLRVAIAHENLHLQVPTTYRRKSICMDDLPPTPFVSPTVFKGGNDNIDDKLKHLSVNEYDYEM